MSSVAIDTLIGNADAFPVLRHWNYFNHAGVSPLPRIVADVYRSVATEAEQGAYLGTHWYRDVEALRTSAATLIHCSPDEIALVKNTSEGLSTVAYGLDWQPGDRVVTAAIEYPANMYPWMDLARRFGVELVVIPEQVSPDGTRRVPLEAILAAVDHARTKLVTLSHVQFATGERLDVAAIGKRCRERGVLFNVDAIQSLGILPVDVEAMHIDYLSADGHKWLLGPEGAGIFYCRRELIEKTRPLSIGWLNVKDALNYDRYDFTLKPTAGRFEGGTHNVPGFLALKAAIDLLLAVGIEAVAARIRSLGDRLVTGLKVAGYTIASPRGDGEWSGGVSFFAPGRDLTNVPFDLRRNHRTEIALRGGRLRASPHFYNTDAQIDELIQRLHF